MPTEEAIQAHFISMANTEQIQQLTITISYNVLESFKDQLYTTNLQHRNKQVINPGQSDCFQKLFEN